MPLFRFHKGSLIESLSTTIVVKTLNDLIEAIVKNDDLMIETEKMPWVFKFSIEPYPSKDDNFDPRIGWFTHIVKANIYEEDKMLPIGFLSEDIQEK